VGQQLGMPHHRADHQLVTLDREPRQLRQAVDVDQRFRLGQAQLHHRDETVAAGDDPRLRAVPLQELEGVRDAVGSLVLEHGGNLHECTVMSPICRDNPQIRDSLMCGGAL
jgi:hypothetical protein